MEAFGRSHWSRASLRLGRRFEIAGESGEYFVIDLTGNLQVWDHYGLISTAKKLQMDDYP